MTAKPEARSGQGSRDLRHGDLPGLISGSTAGTLQPGAGTVSGIGAPRRRRPARKHAGRGGDREAAGGHKAGMLEPLRAWPALLRARRTGLVPDEGAQPPLCNTLLEGPASIRWARGASLLRSAEGPGTEPGS